MGDVGGNRRGVYFTSPVNYDPENAIVVDEPPAMIEVQTRFPDSTPPELDLNADYHQAEPTNPDAPNGETRVDITFRSRTILQWLCSSRLHLRDPQGVRHGFSHYGPYHGHNNYSMYFIGDPTVYRTYQKTVILPIGSALLGRGGFLT